MTHGIKNLGLSNGLFPSYFPIKILYEFLYRKYMTSPSHSPSFDHRSNSSRLKTDFLLHNTVLIDPLLSGDSVNNGRFWATAR
jgi:hypothetical protein